MAKPTSSLPPAALAIDDPSRIRNVVLLGHTQSGKTQLAESLLSATGRIPAVGLVDAGVRRERALDTSADERERGITYQTATASTAIKDASGEWVKINLLDTPGVGELFSDAYGALHVAAGGILCVSAQDGVKTVTRRAFRLAQERGMGLIAAVTKLDKENTDFETVTAQMAEALGRAVIPVHLPLGHGPDFKGLVDLLEMKAWLFAKDGSGEAKPGDIPRELAEKARDMRLQIEELVAEGDEHLMEEYFENGHLSPESFARGVREGVLHGAIVPVLAVSNATHIGAMQVLAHILDLLPSPADRPIRAIKDDQPAELRATIDAPAVAYVYRSATDPYATSISYMKLVSGRLRAGEDLVVAGRGTVERIAHLYTPLGAKLDEVDHVVAGDIFCAVKMRDTRTNDTLAIKGVEMRIPPVTYPKPSLSVALTPANRAQEDKLHPSLEKLMFEDPRLATDRDVETHELVLVGAGQLHLELALARLRERFSVEVTAHPPHIPYRETIRGKVDIHSRHKKQTGGHGQFADIKVVVEPLPAGKGFEFVDAIVGGVVPRNFIPAVEKGFHDASAKGALAGYPAVDFRVTLYDGQYHAVDSSDMAFQIAARQAFRDAWPKAKPTLLEPVMAVEIAVPEECTGDIMSDLNRRRGRVRGMLPEGTDTTITAEVPLSEMLTYANTLKALTGDRGSFTMTFLGYEEVPGNLQDKIVAERVRHHEDA
jgi:elongation factor G